MKRLRVVCLEDRVNERIGDCAFRWFNHIETMESSKFLKTVYNWESLSNLAVGRWRNREKGEWQE